VAPLSAADSASVAATQGASHDGDILDGALAISDPDFVDLDWDGADVNFVDFLNSEMNNGAVQDHSSTWSPLAHQSIPPADAIVHIQQVLSRYNVRALILRPKMRLGGQRTANLILHTLKSYPQMMLRHNTLPPFIHPRLIASDFDMEPLTNCISLVHMIRAGAQGSRKLFWKNVRLECERFCEDVSCVCTSEKDA
jgi:hypothetical protein